MTRVCPTRVTQIVKQAKYLIVMYLLFYALCLYGSVCAKCRSISFRWLGVHTCVKVRQGCYVGVKWTPLWLPSACWHRRRKGTRLASITQWKVCLCVWRDNIYYYYHLFLVKYPVTDTCKGVTPNLIWQPELPFRFSSHSVLHPQFRSFLCLIVKRTNSNSSPMSDYVRLFSCFPFIFLFSLPSPHPSHPPLFSCPYFFLLPPFVFSLARALPPSHSTFLRIPGGNFLFLDKLS